MTGRTTGRSSGSTGSSRYSACASASVVASLPQNVWQTQTLMPMPSVSAIPAAVPGESKPPAPQAPKSAKVLKEEEDARMLVSDLLDIGVKQRKAYEEAQKRASPPNP